MSEAPRNFTAPDSNVNTLAEDRRKSPRYPLEAVLAIQPVDERGHPHGNLAIGQCVNVSGGGIALMCKRAITARYLDLNPLTPGVGLAGTTIEVVRVDAVGDDFEVAGKFVTLPIG